MKKIRFSLAAIGFLIILMAALLLYKYYPVFEAHYYNGKIDVAGVKLLMTEEELNSFFAEPGEFVYGMGGNGWRFQEENIFVMTSSVGLFKNKVASIETGNPSHSIFGLKVGDDYTSASYALKKKGFKETSSHGIFLKGNTQIQLSGGSKVSRIRITIQDPAYRDVVF